MKTIYRLTIAALAAALALTSCTREEGGAEGNRISGADGLRVITLSYGASTKATLDGLQPRFEAGDVIKVAAADGSVPAEDCTVTVEGGVATITTHIVDVALKAAFPSTAAVMSGEQITGVVPAAISGTQTGAVEDWMAGVAAMANIAAGATAAAFEIQSQMALLKITPPSGTTKLTVKSLKPVVGGVSRTGTAADINTENTGKTVITVGDGSANLPGTIYVAFVPGVKLTDLSFDAGENIGLKGIPTSKLGTRPDETVLKGKYSIDADNWHPYVTIGGKKWATMNIGATSPTDYGTYFMWGETTGITPSISTFPFPNTKYYYSADNSTWNKAKGFAWENCPWTNGVYWTSGESWATSNVFTKYTGSNTYAKSGTADNKTTLDLADDAANANWGGPWRMPTGGASGEFQALHTAAPGVWATEIGVNGLKFTETSTSKKLFFPAAGCGAGTSRIDPGSYGYYWSSSLYTDYSNYAYRLYFTNVNTVYPDSYQDRKGGYLVRPVSD